MRLMMGLIFIMPICAGTLCLPCYSFNDGLLPLEEPHMWLWNQAMKQFALPLNLSLCLQKPCVRS